MADPKTSQTGWIQYGYNRRYNPNTGEVQYDLKGTGDWQTVADTGKYDPQNPLQSFGLANPNLKSDPSLGRQFLLNQGGWALPSADTLRQINMMSQMAQNAPTGQAGSAASGTQGASTGTGIGAAPSYWGAAPQGGTGGAQGGVQGATGAPGAQTGGSSMATNVASQISPYSSLPAWQAWYGQNVGKQMMVNGQAVTIGQDVTADQLLQAFRTNPNSVGWNVPASGPQQPAQAIGGPGQAQPESVALAQMAQIDPTSEALRTGLGQSYLTQLAKTSQPSAADFQSLLKTYAQIDPTGAAARTKLGQDLAAQEALGTKLDPATQREVAQATRQAQIARGNVYGTPQLVQEAMTRGQAGLALQQQRQQALQGYLQSGQTTGDVAMNLYNQRQNQLRASQGAALGYLGSGQTPYQAGSTYLTMAEQRAASAAQGGPQYNPQALGQQYTGAGAPSFPQYGLDMSQLAGNWYNNINQANLQAYGLGQAYGQKGGSGMGAATGALSGAASGALAGSAAMPGWGTVIGAGVGALAGGLGGYSK